MNNAGSTIRLPDPLPKSVDAPLRLLAGVRVVDVTTSLAGPYATLLLADLGAEIIKVERPGIGDDSRHWKPPELGGKALWYCSINRNKRSVALDYSNEAGREVLFDLVRSSDVFITNQLPMVQAKLGIDWKSIKAVKPDIVFVSLTGFGLEGARSDDPCYDLIAEGYSGVMDLTGSEDRGPQKVGTPAADLLAGTDAALACVAALFERRSSGSGHLIDIALVDSMVRFMTPKLVSYMGTGTVPRRTGGTDSVIAVYQVFETADEPITLGLANNNTWRRFCNAVGLQHLINDPALADNAGRVEARSRLVAEIAPIMHTRSRAAWLELFNQEKVPAGPINSLDQVVADKDLRDRGLFYQVDDAGVGLPQVGLGITVDREVAGCAIIPQHLGQDTDRVLAEILQYDDKRVASLRQEQLI
jgi:crotonobetainyl-CoA:carnitine CoA-transferase CaiB-like acyl-CoA transferase